MGHMEIDALLASEEDLNSTDQRKYALWDAFLESDSHFDGRLYVGVKSTGIYCRPRCNAGNLPKMDNCTFYRSDVAAEKAGFRPCLRCRPELAPRTPKGNEKPEHMQHLHLAKSLLTDTRAPSSVIAQACGFDSAPQMLSELKSAYGLDEQALRRRPLSKANSENIHLKLDYRLPFEFDRLLQFFRYRQLDGVELVDDKSYARSVNISQHGKAYCGWVKVSNDPKRLRLNVEMSESLLPAAGAVLKRISQQFDVSCIPEYVHDALACMDDVAPGANVSGTRVPGAFDPFEIAVRAVLGQQISVKAANRLATRIAEAYGAPLPFEVTPPGIGLERLFPTAEDFANMQDIEESLGVLGVIASRSRTIKQLAEMAVQGSLCFELGEDPKEQLDVLLSVKGIGPWSANYIAMRAMGYKDAFLESDAGVKHALAAYTPAQRLDLAEKWRPYRSYAVLNLWNSLA